MLDPRSLYTVEADVWESVRGTRPVLIHLLEGFMDAGRVARQLSEHLLATSAPQTLATFDIDQLHDYRARRPPMVFDTNTWVSLEEHALVLHKATDADGQVFLMLTGPEPDSQWQRACAAVLGIAEALDVSMLISAHGVPMGVPHTRPTLVTRHATDPSLVTDNPLWIDRVTVPGSFSAMLEWRAGRAGRLAQGFVAHVPHYLAGGDYVPGTVALLERLRDVSGLALPPGELATLARQILGQLESEVESDAELGPLVSSLERQYDELQASERPSVPSADEIGAALEAFLAEHGDEDQGRPDGTH